MKIIFNLAYTVPFQVRQHARPVVRHNEAGGQDAGLDARRERLRQRGPVLQERLLGHTLPRHTGPGQLKVMNGYDSERASNVIVAFQDIFTQKDWNWIWTTDEVDA